MLTPSVYILRIRGPTLFPNAVQVFPRVFLDMCAAAPKLLDLRCCTVSISVGCRLTRGFALWLIGISRGYCVYWLLLVLPSGESSFVLKLFCAFLRREPKANVGTFFFFFFLPFFRTPRSTRFKKSSAKLASRVALVRLPSGTWLQKR